MARTIQPSFPFIEGGAEVISMHRAQDLETRAGKSRNRHHPLMKRHIHIHQTSGSIGKDPPHPEVGDALHSTALA